MDSGDTSLRRLRGASRTVLFVALGAASIAICFKASFALIPAAAVFGWTQITGL